MKKLLRSQIVLAAAVSLAGAMCFAQSGAATYKSRCAMCHGATGTPSAGMAKMMGIKPASDPSMKRLSVAQIEATIKGGKGKMKAIGGLNDAQAKAVAEYFKTLK
jgi:mono/diheme cytochrome c family protein